MKLDPRRIVFRTRSLAYGVVLTIAAAATPRTAATQPVDYRACGTFACISIHTTGTSWGRDIFGMYLTGIEFLPAYTAAEATTFDFSTGSVQIGYVDLDCVARTGSYAFCGDGGSYGVLWLTPRRTSYETSWGGYHSQNTRYTIIPSYVDLYAYNAAGTRVGFDRSSFVAIAAVPEPATLALVGGGLLVLGAWTRRRRQS